MDEIKENSRNEKIHEKGFNISDRNFISNEYGKIKIGVKSLDDAILNLGSLQQCLNGRKYVNKNYILQALANHDLVELRNISNFYYNVNGIYQKICNYFSYLYRYDWYLVPEVYDKNIKEEKILKDFIKILNFLDDSYIKKTCGDIALEVIKNGAFYGYVVPSQKGVYIQQLPIGYCRTRYNVGNFPVVEFNMKFFDTFKNPGYRLKVLKLFPDEFSKGYALYKKGKLVDDCDGMNFGMDGWFVLEPKNTVKFAFNNGDIPMFVNSVPSLIDLDAAQDLDRRKQMQKLLKIIIQKLPMDKNGELIFDIDEARDIHNNAVEMLRRAVGVDVLTTFADIESVDMADKNTATSTDDLKKVERAVFNSVGISQNLFNTDGNMSLEKSILNDEGSVRSLLLQFAMFYNRIVNELNLAPKKYKFKLYMLETTQYNYKELSKMYKEQTQIGYSKMLPQIALGHSQSAILNAAHFENEILHLSDIMIPPMMSSTMSSKTLDKTNQNNKNKTQTKIGNKNNPVEDKSVGRPEKPDDQKSDKTIANRESMG